MKSATESKQQFEPYPPTTTTTLPPPSSTLSPSTSTMQTRSSSSRNSLLGKRSHQSDTSSPPVASSTCAPPTPESTPNPKRPRISITGLEGDGNKENVPPFRAEVITDPSPTTSTGGRAPPLRRTSTELTTPSRSRITPRQASTSNIFQVPATPTAEIAHLTLSTPPPTPPTSLLPIHARARFCLRATCNSNAEIAGRDTEHAVIRAFVSTFLQVDQMEVDDTGASAVNTTLYISGSPGTGKTALVNSVLRDLESEPGLKVVSVNCMALNNVDALWDHLLDELMDGKKVKGWGKKPRGREAVLKALSEIRHSRCILVLDELDHIAASPQSLVSLFSLPNSSPSSLRIIGIANTHTLTSSMSQFSMHGDVNVQTLHFAPYTHAQLLEILQTRFSPLYDEDSDVKAKMDKFLSLPTLTLLTKKIAVQTGDVRSLFEVLRGAIDLVTTPASTVTSDLDSNPLNTPPPVVCPQHILSALKTHTTTARPGPGPAQSSSVSSASSASAPPLRAGGNSETATKVRGLGMQARLVLLSVLLAAKRLEAGLALSPSASACTSPSKSPSKGKLASPRSPVKRALSSSASSSGNGAGVELSTLHAYYAAMLTRAAGAVFAPVSRSEFGDIAGMLEVVGLASLSSLSSLSSQGGGKRSLSRSASFGGRGMGIGVQGVKIAEGVRSDEILRGLGIGEVVASGDVREEEVRAIWQREMGKLGRDVKAAGAAEERMGKGKNAFVDAVED